MNPSGAPGTLFVIGTPIGNLEDITFRAVRMLNASAAIAAEDTRVTHKLTSYYGISTPIVSILGDGARRHIAKLVEQLKKGEDVSLVSDAGTPSVSDPGVELVEAALDAGIPISPIPGPSALATALSVVGLKGEGVRFFGFLPRDGRRRRDLVAAISTERALAVIYESPRRIGDTLAELAVPSGARRCVIFRELTKIHEQISRGTLRELAVAYAVGEVRGEITLVIEGVNAEGGSDLTDEALREMICDALKRGRTVRDIAAALSEGLGLPRKSVYERAVTELMLLSEGSDDR